MRLPKENLITNTEISEQILQCRMVFDMRELAIVLHCSYRHVQQLKSEGRLPPSIVIGRKHLWRVETIWQLLVDLEDDLDEKQTRRRPGRPTKIQQRQQRLTACG